MHRSILPIMICLQAGPAWGMSSADLLRTCETEAAIEATDPRYQEGLCLAVVSGVLDGLRSSAGCAADILAGNAEIVARDAVIAGLRADPDRADDNAADRARSILIRTFTCSM